MSLRDIAARDHASILATGFSAPVTVRSPEGLSLTLSAMSADTGELVDPETGVAVLGRYVRVVLELAPLRAAGLGDPRGIADGASRPWLITFPDSRGLVRTYKVQETRTDDVLGSVVCELEPYRTGA